MTWATDFIAEARATARAAPPATLSIYGTRRLSYDLLFFSSSCRARLSQTVDLRRHNEIVLVEPLDLLGTQRHRRIAPTETDVGVVAFGLCKLPDPLYESQCVAKVPKTEGPLDPARLVHKHPFRRLGEEGLGFLRRQRRGAAATGRAGLLDES